jgi:signal recognition particle GTPase
MLVAADVYRPAAIDQLTILGKKVPLNSDVVNLLAVFNWKPFIDISSVSHNVF